MRYLGLIIMAFILSFSLNAQDIFQTNVFDKMINTLQVKVAGEPLSDPIIALNGDNQIEINFDVMDPAFQYFSYSVIHCDADWKKSSLIPLEYMDGFDGLPIEDFANGMGTTVAYTNYQLRIPNNDIRLKTSGNYVVNIYRENNPSKPVLTACFYVVEPLVDIAAGITSNTLIDTNRSHQQINFNVNTSRFPISYPQSDLKVFVYQNNRRDNAVTGIMPSNISNRQIEYANLRELIFEAGNEYRRFEFLSNNFNGMGVEDISFHNPYYHVTLRMDASRANRSYIYDRDQNGRFIVNCRSCTDVDTQADYYIVHFALDNPPLLDGKVYISSDLFNNALDERSRMIYNQETGLYEKTCLVKQGLYNYQYLFVPNGKKQGSTSTFEGNYFQTENEYQIFLYYRPMSERYDRLIGIRHISNEINAF